MSATHTTYYNLNKPDRQDFVSVVSDINDNMDKIDAAIHEVDTGKVDKTEKGVANGIASLDVSGKVPSSQLPSYVDDVIEGYLYNGQFYEESAHTTVITTESDKIYVDIQTSSSYRWSGSMYVRIDSPEEVIDDTKGLNDTTRTYSADKIVKLLEKKANGENVYAYRSKRGSIVTVDDAVAEAVKQMRIEIAPVQDLHGYDNPWPGGAGANLILLESSYATTSNVTYSPDPTTGILTLGGSAPTSLSGSNRMLYEIPVAEGEKYYISGTPENGGGTTNCIRYVFRIESGGSAVGSATDTNYEGVVVTVPATATVLCIYSHTNYGANPVGVVLKPFVAKSSVPLPFAPYSNICPISGRTGANVTRTGKNLIGKPGGINENGVYDSSAKAICSEKINVSQGDAFIASKHHAFSASWSDLKIVLYDSNGDYLSQQELLESAATTGSAYTVQSGTAYVAFSVYVNNTDYSNLDSFKVQVEKGTIASTYEAYQGKTYSITFPSSAGTVYGGTVTVNKDGSGTLVVDRAIANVNNFNGSSLDSVNGLYYSDYTPSNIRGGIEKVINSHYPVLTGNDSWNATYESCSVNNSGRLRVFHKENTLSAWQTAVSDMQFVYELATPVTYTLTAPELMTMLQGYNTVYADCGDVDLLYAVRDFLTQEEVDKERVYETISTPASVMPFSDGADNLPMKVVFGVEPVQDLHGQSNPYPPGSGKNLYDGEKINGYISDTGDEGTDGYAYHSDYIKVTAWSQYTYSLVSQITASSNRRVHGYDSNKDWVQMIDKNTTSGTGQQVCTFTVPNGVEYIRVQFRGNTSETDLNIQVELGSSATDYAPYSNICPISGWTEASVTRTGKNLIPTGTDTSNGYKANCRLNSSGEEVSGSNWNICEYLPVVAGKSYRYESNITAGSASIAFYNSSKTFISCETYNNQYVNTYTAPANAAYARLSIPKSPNWVKLNLYDEYIVHTIPFPSSAGTVYGGTVTVNKDGSGSLVVDNGITDLGDYTYTYDSTYTRFIADSNVPEIISRDARATKCLCSRYKCCYSYEPIQSINIGDFYIASKKIVIHDNFTTDATTFKTAVTGQKVVYPLASPVTYQLSAEQVKTLLGVNNVWVDTGDMQSIVYPADTKLYVDQQIADKISASQRLMELIVTANHEDEMKATKAYNTGDLLIVNGTLYKATTSIANGATLTVNTNVTATTVAAELAALA